MCAAVHDENKLEIKYMIIDHTSVIYNMDLTLKIYTGRIKKVYSWKILAKLTSA